MFFLAFQVVLGIGTTCSIIFHFLVPRDTGSEPVRSNTQTEDNQNRSSLQKLTVLQWLSLRQLYQVALVYLATRLFVNLSQAYIPLFLQVQVHLFFVEYFLFYSFF